MILLKLGCWLFLAHTVTPKSGFRRIVSRQNPNPSIVPLPLGLSLPMPRRKRKPSVNPRKRGRKEAAIKEQGEELNQCPCKFNQLPHAIVMDIFARLTVKALSNCRYVCKDWLHVISDPQFARLHFPRSPMGILMKNYPRLNISRKLDFTHIEESPDSQFRLEKIRFTPQNSLPISDCCLINSCNGLVLVGSKKGDPFYVCNPIFGEYITLPCGHYDSFVGLGFSAATNEYKVLQTKLFKDFVYIEAKVYTIGGKGAWRSIGHAPFDFVNWNFNAYVHGALHWVSVSSFSVSIVIRSFDFEREEFQVVLPPGNFGGREKQFSECVKVGVLRASLVLCVYTDDPSKFDLWVMKDYGVQESWTKILVLDDNYPRGRGLDFYQPMVFLSNGDILMSYNNEDVVCYNKEMKGFTETKITGTQSFRAIAYTPCLVSLRDVSKGEKVKRVRDSKKSCKLFGGGTGGGAGSRIPPPQVHKT